MKEMTVTRLPYTTRTGLKIGSQYMPPQQVRMTEEDEFWQGVLLGIKPKSHLPMAIYVVCLFFLFKFLMGSK